MPRSYFLKSLDYFGKFLLGWFALETILYYTSGRFFIELDDVTYFFQAYAYFDAFYVIFMIVMSGLMIVLIGPFLMDGKWIGLVLALLYLAWGNTINPFWYLLPEHLQPVEEGPQAMFSGVNLAWSGIVVLGIAGFFYFRRWKPTVDSPPEGGSQHGDHGQGGSEHSLGDN